MKTKHVKYFLMDYIDGCLNEQEQEQVGSHLQQCSECQDHYNMLMDVASFKQKPNVSPGITYYSTILPRVRERLTRKKKKEWIYAEIPAKIILPLAVSVLFIIFLINIPFDTFTETTQQEAFCKAVDDLSADEIVQAVINEHSGNYILMNQDIATYGIEENLQNDIFIREAVFKQIEYGDMAEVDMEVLFSEMSDEQAVQLLSRF